jgi:hypothetical protein
MTIVETVVIFLSNQKQKTRVLGRAIPGLPDFPLPYARIIEFRFQRVVPLKTELSAWCTPSGIFFYTIKNIPQTALNYNYKRLSEMDSIFRNSLLAALSLIISNHDEPR